MAATQTLNLDNDAAFLRGLLYADAKLVEDFISAVREIREPHRYSNQDIDRRMHVRGYLRGLREVGNTPLKSAA